MPTLSDAMLRHQIFLEGLKANQNVILTAAIDEIVLGYIKDVTGRNVETLDQLKKTELRSIIANLKTLAIRVYSKYTIKFFTFIDNFVKTETNMSALVIKTTALDLGKNPALRIFNKDFVSKALGKIKNGIVSANGDNLKEFVDNFGKTIIARLEKAVKYSAINSEKVNEFLDTIKANKGGVWKQLINNGKAMAETLIQHISSQVKNYVQSEFYEKYIWVSVLDAGTTNICRHRNGNIYIYGQGPVPPAHFRCRSLIMPYFDDSPSGISSISDWLEQQPNEIKQAANDNPPELTLSQYTARLSSILA